MKHIFALLERRLKLERNWRKTNIVFLDNEQIVDLLLKSGADVNTKDDEQKSPLHRVAYRGKFKNKNN